LSGLVTSGPGGFVAGAGASVWSDIVDAWSNQVEATVLDPSAMADLGVPSPYEPDFKQISQDDRAPPPPPDDQSGDPLPSPDDPGPVTDVGGDGSGGGRAADDDPGLKQD
jgi:hypothetical protein